ncbi:hypothetical protein BO70DRAFT_389752 [Aspergillus heteromorphus CBS 117.55]|uniref:DUF7029 domain-containing protein n=1 Tax=Aspergillus heteromorphus CBS 117.55 TaxID=1448321 RepID=A0A317V9E6_9EURO|nr:uncharacterized protein BO70DRAFT_389752 [Aspergillus heteromorphus CBS 117.55]PWY71013.1 hypothetical protein BO70DRAFT_389752 [Aspergillus heteromorphus CBS 117.55]
MMFSRTLAATAALFLAGCSAAPTQQLYPSPQRRATTLSESIAPAYNVSLYYAATNSSAAATLNAQMKLPTVVLDDISTISSVECTDSDVSITFSSSSAYEQSVSDWSASDLVLLTNNIESCSSVNSGGVYSVSALSNDSTSLTITASATASSFQDEAELLSIVFSCTAAASNKRDVVVTLSDEWSGELVNITDLTIDVNDVDLSTTIDLSGGVDIDLTDLTATTLYLELDLSLYADVSVTAEAKASYSTDLWSYTFDALDVSALDIAGILTIGPSLTFGVGVEFAISGEATATADVSAQIADGKVYLDLLDSSKSTTSGWTPTYGASANLSAEVDAELNPFADVDLSIGVNVLDGLIDLTAGIEAKAEIVNEFSVDGDLDLSTSTGVTFSQGSGDCVNGYWFASDFVFDVEASVTDLFDDTLYTVTVPIYDTECIAF